MSTNNMCFYKKKKNTNICCINIIKYALMTSTTDLSLKCARPYWVDILLHIFQVILKYLSTQYGNYVDMVI